HRTPAPLSFAPNTRIAVDFALGCSARIGGALAFALTLTVQPGTPVLVDYVIHFRRPGGRVSPKTHKLRQAVLTKGNLVLEKRHKLKGDAATFRLVPGTHRIEIQVNGRVLAAAEFDLLEE
ncbi:hypothetical protein AB9K41_15905, partial [Cribrihabitans sp. XS_ASV171]